MRLSVKLRKLEAAEGEPIVYSCAPAGLSMNALLGERLTIRHTGNIHCRVCDRRIPKAYGEGYCYPHFLSDPSSSPCIVHPERCEAHLGNGRDPDWEAEHHARPHVVYLAVSGGLKVGVTGKEQARRRWIDQGASRAMVLAETPYRALAGHIEVALKSQLADRTAWQRMLRGEEAPEIDLAAEKRRAAEHLPGTLQRYVTAGATTLALRYPVLAYPPKVRSVHLDKQPAVTGRLCGIRGQYLLFDGGRVFNVRRHTGYEVELESG